MRKLTVLIFLSILASTVAAADFNQFRPEGEISTNEVTFWGEVISENSGELKLYVNDELVHTSQHNGGRTDFPAGYTQELSSGDYTWFIELDGEQVERSKKMDFSVIKPVFLEFEHRGEGNFDIGASAGVLSLYINNTEIVTRQLEKPYTDTVNLSLKEGFFTYHAELETEDKILDTERKNLTIKSSGQESKQSLDEIDAKFDRDFENNTEASGSSEESLGTINEINKALIIAIVLVLFLLIVGYSKFTNNNLPLRK